MADDLRRDSGDSKRVTTPGHPTKEGAGYDCECGECLARLDDGPPPPGFDPVKDTSPDSADLVSLATTLERLTARVSRDLDADAGESVLPDDPFWADTISRLAEYARECAEILNEPRISAVLTAHLRWHDRNPPA